MSAEIHQELSRIHQQLVLLEQSIVLPTGEKPRPFEDKTWVLGIIKSSLQININLIASLDD
jgi:hypothetical protein